MSSQHESPSSNYLVIRGQEDCSILMAVRVNIASALECLYWERRFEGFYQTETKCNSRCMVAKVTLDQSIGHFGKEVVITGVHMQNDLANGMWPRRLPAFWNWCYALSEKYRVTVLMGDSNMSFFQLIPEFRKRETCIYLAAWYPLKNEEGTACADSCGILAKGTRSPLACHSCTPKTRRAS